MSEHITRQYMMFDGERTTMSTEQFPVCCADMAKAFKSETTHDEYGSLAVLDQGGLSFGAVAPAIFCPWCGMAVAEWVEPIQSFHALKEAESEAAWEASETRQKMRAFREAFLWCDGGNRGGARK